MSEYERAVIASHEDDMEISPYSRWQESTAQLKKWITIEAKDREAYYASIASPADTEVKP